MKRLSAVLLTLLLAPAAAGCGGETLDAEEVETAFAAEGIELSLVDEGRFALLSSGAGVDVAVLANEPEARSFAEDAVALMGLAGTQGLADGGSRTVVRRLNVVVVHDAGFEDEVAAALGRL